MHILNCGQGDTILLRLLSGKWALIDCNLPRGNARLEFFKLTSSLNINRLDLVCLTHPHDGSLDSHAGSDVCKHKKTNTETVAAISAGPFDVLPDREVLKDFIRHDWTVLLTTKRMPTRRQYALELSGKPVGGAMNVQAQNITLTWTEDEGLLWSPAEARVSAEELSNYQTAGL